MKTGSCPMRGQVDDLFARTLTPGAERSLREHLRGCGSCRSLYEWHLLVRKRDPRAAMDGQGTRRARLPVSVARGVTVLAAVALLAVGVLATWPAAVAEANGFTEPGGPVVTSAEALRVYRVRAGRAVEAVEGELRVEDELAFAYQNPRGRKWLLIYGVDEHQRVYWFHPSRSNPAEEPAAVQAFGGAALHELPEAISHTFAGERLVVHGILADERLTVKQAEALMQGRDPTQPLSLPGAEHTTFTLRVRR